MQRGIKAIKLVRDPQSNNPEFVMSEIHYQVNIIQWKYDAMRFNAVLKSTTV